VDADHLTVGDAAGRRVGGGEVQPRLDLGAAMALQPGVAGVEKMQRGLARD